jgi:hypothetical protein
MDLTWKYVIPSNGNYQPRQVVNHIACIRTNAWNATTSGTGLAVGWVSHIEGAGPRLMIDKNFDICASRLPWIGNQSTILVMSHIS